MEKEASSQASAINTNAKAVASRNLKIGLS
jgi:hypothetical protein